MKKRAFTILVFLLFLLLPISAVDYFGIWSCHQDFYKKWSYNNNNEHIYVWNSSLEDYNDALDKAVAHNNCSVDPLAKKRVVNGWWGYGLTDDYNVDLMHYSDGYLTFFIRTPNYYGDIKIQIKDKDNKEYVWTLTENDYPRNDEWYLIELPLSEASKNINFSEIRHVFEIHGDGEADLIGIDEIIYRTSSSSLDGGDYYEHTYAESGTFVVPENVTSINVRAWGGGGGGGSGNKEWDWEGGSGGGGGGYVEGTISVTPGQVINYTVGHGGAKASCESGKMNGGDGGDSEFLTIKSFGGKGGAENAGNSGAGGGGAGGTVHYGEYGHNGGNNYGGRGGNSPYGGHGGAGATGEHMSGWGGDGNIPGGGGGGGARWNSDSWCEHGGVGGRGEIKISYNVNSNNFIVKDGEFVVPAGVSELFVECWGAGGGGGGSNNNNNFGSGGGGGGYASGVLFVTPGDIIPYTVGVGGGRGGENGGSGGNGGRTQMLDLIAFGGNGGSGGSISNNGGEGGSASGEGVYKYNFIEGEEGSYRSGNNGNEGYGGKGASEFGGNGGAQGTGGFMSGWGANGEFPGGGGGGGAKWGDYPGEKGGRGANGAIRITYKANYVEKPVDFQDLKNAICVNSDTEYKVPLNPNPKLTYIWSYSGSNSSLINQTGSSITLRTENNATGGTLSVKANDSYGESEELTVSITVNPSYEVNISLSDEEVCKVESFVVEALPITGNWTNYYLMKNDEEIDSSVSTTFIVNENEAGTHRFKVVGKDVNGCYVESDEKNINILGTQNLWIGKNDSNWDTNSNWCDGVVAENNQSIVISAGNYHPKLLGNAKFNNVSIQKNAILEIMPGAKIDITGNLNVDSQGQFILNSNYSAGGLSSVKMSNAMTGEAKVKLTLPTNQWYYLSTPISTPSTNHFGVGDVSGTYAYTYSTGKEWVKENTSKSISKAEGMLVYYEDKSSNEEVTLEYSGALNSGTIQKQYTSKNYYLFGNPFPVSLNWQDETWVRNRIYGTIWYRTRIDNEMVFITYNKDAPSNARVAVYPDNTEWGEESELAMIPPYQSVWIYTKTASVANPAEIIITDSQKAHGANSTLKSSSTEAVANIIRVVAQNDKSRDGTIIYFSEESEDKFDKGDSQKYFNSSVNIPEVYTRIGREALAINGLAPFDGSYEIPLSVRNLIKMRLI